MDILDLPGLVTSSADSLVSLADCCFSFVYALGIKLVRGFHEICVHWFAVGLGANQSRDTRADTIFCCGAAWNKFIAQFLQFRKPVAIIVHKAGCMARNFGRGELLSQPIKCLPASSAPFRLDRTGFAGHNLRLDDLVTINRRTATAAWPEN